MESEDDVHSPQSLGRVGRALALMALSVLAIGIATLAYAHPQLSTGSGKQLVSTPALVTSYQVSTLDFVDPTTGWVVVELRTHDFAVLHTTNAGRSWSQQLTGTGGANGEYARFFDKLHGVIVLLGPQAVMFQTADRGKTWSRDNLQVGGGHVLSAEFVDAQRGWLLVQVEPSLRGAPTEALYRTSDGGATWVDLGDPVLAEDWAYHFVFADSMRGWLYSRSSGGYAYASDDGGSTWRRVVLPAPKAGWPVAPAGATGPEEFFVAVRPTAGSGVLAVVVPIAPLQGRSANGGVLIGYPPLTVRGFDGGGSMIYQYATLADSRSFRVVSFLGSPAEPGLWSAAADADQVEFSSADAGTSWRSISTPAAGGVVGYADALDWWWLGAGSWATTSDAGVMWTRTSKVAIPEPLPGSLQVLDPDHAWFAAIVGSRPVLEMTEDGGHEWMAVGLPPIRTTPTATRP